MSKFLTSSRDINLINGTADLNVNSITANTTDFADGGGGGGGGGIKTVETFAQQSSSTPAEIGEYKLYAKSDGFYQRGTGAEVKLADAGINYASGSFLQGNGVLFRNGTDTTLVKNAQNFALVNLPGIGDSLLCNDIQLPSIYSLETTINENKTKLTKITYDTTDPLNTFTKIDGELDVDKIKNTNGTAEVELQTDGKININADNTIIMTTPLAFQQYGGSIGLLSNSSILSSATTSNTIASNNDITLTTTNGGINLYTNNLCKIENVATTSGFSINPNVPEIILKKNSIQNASFGITASNVVDLTASLPVNIHSVNDTLNIEGYSSLTMSSTTADLTLSAGGNVLCNNTPTIDNSIVNKVYVDSKLPKTGTLADMLALTGMSAGDQFFLNYDLGSTSSSHKNKMCFWTGRTWQVIGETVELNLEMTVDKGNTMEVGVLADYAMTKTTATASEKCIGVIAFQAEVAGQWATLATRGIWEVACEAGTYNRGRYLQTDTIDGLARETSYVTEQPFAKILENKTELYSETLVWALLHTQEIY